MGSSVSTIKEEVSLNHPGALGVAHKENTRVQKKQKFCELGTEKNQKKNFKKVCRSEGQPGNWTSKFEKTFLGAVGLWAPLGELKTNN